MLIILYPDADAAVVDIRPGQPHHTTEVDDATFLDVDAADSPMSIQFLYVSDGVGQQQIPGLTDQENQQVLSLLRESGIKVIPSA